MPSIGLLGLTHPYRGHWFYCLTTLDNRTLVYDVATGNWHERSTSANGIGPWQAEPPPPTTIHCICMATAPGQLYTLAMAGDDAGVAVIRQATLPPLVVSSVRGARAFCSRAEIEMEVGGAQTPGPVLLQWSDDGGRTWNAGRTMSAGVPAITATGCSPRGSARFVSVFSGSRFTDFAGYTP